MLQTSSSVTKMSNKKEKLDLLKQKILQRVFFRVEIVSINMLKWNPYSDFCEKKLPKIPFSRAEVRD